MAIWAAIILGAVQGLTEFLPVSSSGHLMLFQRLFGFENDLLLFDIVLHLATLCAVVIVFRKKIWELVRHPFCKASYCLVIATVITCAIVIIFKDFIDKTMNSNVLPVTFLITAIVLFGTSLFPSGFGKKSTASKSSAGAHTQSGITYKTSIIAGLAQGIAVIPGISRSGSTIAACLYTGTERSAAAEFSFLLSIPVIIASFVFELVSNPSAIASVSLWPLFFGFATALLCGILAIQVMLKLIKNVKLYWFSIYLVLLSIVLVFVIYL